jgi:aminoglycoside phosphotransferase (APT) family kinase protein
MPLTREQIGALLGRPVHAATLAEGGLVNTVYRVDANGGPFALRLFSAGAAGREKEQRLLERLAPVLPVPEIVDVGHAHLLTRWIEGLTLNAFRRAANGEVPPRWADQLGALVARIALMEADALVETRRPLADVVAHARRCLQAGTARARMGAALADVLDAQLSDLAPSGDVHLCHGDLGARNILVSPGGDIAGLIDWEDAFRGSALYDVGSLFRYPRRFDDAFGARFATAYREAGGTLRDDWRRTALLVDACRQIDTLEEPVSRPAVFSEVIELLQTLAFSST